MMPESGQWYSMAGPEMDVAVSSRVRLSRNLMGYLFPPMASKDQEELAREEIVSAFEKLPGGFKVISLDSISPLERRILMERNLISQEFSASPNKVVLLSEDEKLSAMINEEDHLRLVCIQSGLALEEVYRKVEKLDSRLEASLHFAASMEWGYLNTSLQNTGTGLRASVMLHLPALVMEGNVGWALKMAGQMGLAIKGHWGEGENSLGDMYQISNPISLGLTEREILETVQSTATTLMEYERKARTEMLKNRRLELEDAIFRAYGLLAQCRLISSKESIELLAKVRLGVSLGVLSKPTLEAVTALMILSQKSHIQKMLDTMDDESDNKLVDYTRAKLLRRALEEGNV
jgi:protein arginine kinase